MSYEIPEWAQTPPDATTPRLLSSYSKATKNDTTPFSVDTEHGTAHFVGKHGNYFTTLQGCPCGSFPKPCKHMYRLALELGIMPGLFSSDHAKISNRKAASDSKISNSDLRTHLEVLSPDACELLLSFLPFSGEAGSNYVVIPRTSAVSELIASGFLMESNEKFQELKPHCDRKALQEYLLSMGIVVSDNALNKGARWTTTWAFLDRIRESMPNHIAELLATVDGTPFSYDKAFMIRAILDPDSGERVRAENLRLF